MRNETKSIYTDEYIKEATVVFAAAISIAFNLHIYGRDIHDFSRTIELLNSKPVKWLENNTDNISFHLNRAKEILSI